MHTLTIINLLKLLFQLYNLPSSPDLSGACGGAGGLTQLSWECREPSPHRGGRVAAPVWTPQDTPS